MIDFSTIDRSGDSQDPYTNGRNHTSKRASLEEVKLKRIYGKTSSEMHAAYRDRVRAWAEASSSQDWIRSYSENNTKNHIYRPRDRDKSKELGGANFTISNYKPRGKYKGGGKCLEAPSKTMVFSASTPALDTYQPRVLCLAKEREKEKEIQQPMRFLKNRPLHCGKYFNQDILCDSDGQRLHKSRSVDGPISKNREGIAPTTAEYVASPEWRPQDRSRWVHSNNFVSTCASSKPWIAQTRSITGEAYSRPLRIEDPYTRNVPPKDELATEIHARRAMEAQVEMRRCRSPQIRRKNYLMSVWETSEGSAVVKPCHDSREQLLLRLKNGSVQSQSKDKESRYGKAT